MSAEFPKASHSPEGESSKQEDSEEELSPTEYRRKMREAVAEIENIQKLGGAVEHPSENPYRKFFREVTGMEVDPKVGEQALERLPSREADVLRQLYGLDGEEPITIAEVARRTGVSRSRINMVRTRALGKLRFPTNPYNNLYPGAEGDIDPVTAEESLRRLRPEEADILRMSFGLGEQKVISRAEIAEKLGIRPEQVSAIKQEAFNKLWSERRRSLKKPDNSYRSLGISLKDEEMGNPEVAEQALKRLPSQEEEALRARFGIGGGEPMTYRQVAEHLEIQPSTVRNVLRRALQKLQKQKMHNK